MTATPRLENMEYYDESTMAVSPEAKGVVLTHVEDGFTKVDDATADSPRDNASWPALVSRVPSTASAENSWVYLKPSFKQALASTEGSFEPCRRKLPEVQRRERRKQSKELVIIDDDEDEPFPWYGAVGDQQMEYAQRNRRSKQSALSRSRRLVQKAVANSSRT